MLRGRIPYSVLAMLVSTMSVLAAGCAPGTGSQIARASTAPTAAPAEGEAEKEKEKVKVGTKSDESSKPNPARGGILDADEKTTGKITGVITFAGEKPKLAPISVDRDHKDRGYCGAQIANQEIILGEKNTVANVVVSLVKVPDAGRPKPRTPELANAKCVFEPRVIATTRGSSLKITSRDPGIFHSAHGYLGNEFNIAITNAGQEQTIRRLRKGWTMIKCDGHAWMRADLWVFEHDFFAITGKDGTFSLEGVPPGEYDLMVWHEKLAFSLGAESEDALIRKVKVSAGASTKADFELKPKK